MHHSEVEIVIIEDNPSDAELLMRVFKKQNMLNNIVLLRDGEEALNYFFDGSDTHNKDSKNMLVLLDLKLPKVDGIEILRRIRSNDRTKEIPVIVLTSSQEDRDLSDAYNNGVSSYVTKPINFKDFAKITSSLQMHWLLINENPQGN